MAASNVRQLPQPVPFVPGTTLGRSGHVPSKCDRLGQRIEFLDALLSLVAIGLHDEDAMGFSQLNSAIQASVLELASSLATEVHELHSEISIDRYNAKAAA